MLSPPKLKRMLLRGGAYGSGVGSGPAPFLIKTYEMMDDSTTDAIVSWSRNRKSFVVWDQPEFQRLLLPSYFKHNNFSSFIRQLNTYKLTCCKMYIASQKIHKDKDAEPTEVEENVAQALFDLENTNQEIKSDLKDLHINSAVQIDVPGGKMAVVIHVPYRLRRCFRKIHSRLVRELEKEFSEKEVIFIASRRIVRPPKKGSAVQKPQTRTLTAMHEAMLDDIICPAEVVGKCVRYRLDGSEIMKDYDHLCCTRGLGNSIDSFSLW